MSDSIRTVIENNEQIIHLWQDAFGDSREDIQYFMDNCKHKTIIGCFKNESLVSMLVFVDCKVNNEKCKYIYAACTKTEYRNSGMMTKLLDYTKTLSDRIVLIPADEQLVDYYRKREFDKKIPVDSIEFNESEDIKEYLLEGCELENPFAICYVGE